MLSTTRPCRLVQAAVALSLAFTFASLARAGDVQLNAARKYQQIAGWEVTASGLEVTSSGTYDPWWAQGNAAVLDRLVNELGINRIRIEIGSGSENPVDYWSQFRSGQINHAQRREHYYEKINDNSDPLVAAPGGFQFAYLDFRVESELLPMKQRVEANGEKLFVNLCYVDFRSPALQGPLSHALNSAEYSELIVATFDHLKNKYQIKPDALELILEPDNSAEWRGTQIGRAALAVKIRLHSAGYDPELIAPSTSKASAALPYLSEMVAVAGAASAVNTLAYHLYAPGDLAAILATASSYGMRTAMLEYINADVDDLLTDLTVANVSAWQKYAIAQPTAAQDYAYYTVDRTNPVAPSINLNARAAPLQPYLRYIRNGAQRIEATSNDAQVRPVAFINASGGYVVVVKATSATSVRFLGLPAATYGKSTVRLNSLTVEAGANIVTAGGELTVTVPAGVTALYDKRAAAGGNAAASVPALPAPAFWLLGLGLVGLGARQLRRRHAPH